MGMVSGQPWPGCQLALQAEQNSVSQALHWTSWGVCSPISWSWHTAWHVDAGHQVRQGSRSTSDTKRKNGRVRICRTRELTGLRTDGHASTQLLIFKGEKKIKVRYNMPFRIWDPPGGASSLQPLPTPQPTRVVGQQTPNYPQSPQGSRAPSWKPRDSASASCPRLPALRRGVATATRPKPHILGRGVLWAPETLGKHGRIR